jgi:glutathionylspermidine synthase
MVTMTEPWRRCAALDPATMRAVRETMIFEHCKWDPQVGDTDVLCATPLVLKAEVAEELARLAEAMAAEVVEAEAAILGSARALAELGLPRALRRALAAAGAGVAWAEKVRVMRFDFHATAEGWRVSEVNSDVPGGYVETRGLAAAMAPYVGGLRPAGDPVAALVGATAPGARVALVHATAYTDDRQVMVYLARALEAAGRRVRLLGPDQVRWRNGRAYPKDGCGVGDDAFDAVFRFYPAEWLPNLGWWSGWRDFVRGGVTPQLNPPGAVVSQSKRFPLACARLGLRLPTWDALVPETRDPRAVFGRGGAAADEAEWVLKPALGRVGEGVGLGAVTPAGEWGKIRKAARRWPELWAAQWRFRATAWETDAGPRYPCLGVYVIGGKAAGIYGRAAARPLVDAQAQDVAVLVEEVTFGQNNLKPHSILFA